MSKTILVVDDEKMFCEIISERLRGAGYTVLTAENGQEAVEILAKNKVDVVLSDVKMPVMNGMDLLKHVQELIDKPEMVMMTGYSDYSEKEMVDAGAVAVLEKPGIWDKLIATLSTIRLH